MKGVLLLILALCTKPVFGQSIVGFWQADDTTVAAGYKAHYIFSANKKFTYNVNEEDGLSRIRTIGGRYSIKGTMLLLTPEYTVELVGGTLERSHIVTGHDSWSIENTHQKTYKITKPVAQETIFKLIKRKKGWCLLLDTWPYYRIKGTK
ncbi:hypothetical protein FNT36_02025 [Hymenobacter setariae]|uniref:DUF4488 domain-containing protein n=1 Tax=Hymenobacter setariae TaxID=2594794 RepID=A0A558C274_9BACT|nr:hypothetical protein [Hymenobacter setariae]TVT42893.1 hypothetical protein FNT36_02025 [Hymenobacter setariae]